MKTIKLFAGELALVDDWAFEFLSKYRWHMAHGYVVHSSREHGRTKLIFMHKIVAMASADVKVDHKDRNKLNNQLYNLRKATDQTNSYNQGMHTNNTSGFKGVTRRPIRQNRKLPWVAQIRFNNRNHHIGYFSTPEEAAKAYDEAVSAHHGEFGSTNKMLQEARA